MRLFDVLASRIKINFEAIILNFSQGGSASGASAAAITRDALAPLIGLDDEGSAGSDDTDEEEPPNRSCSVNGDGAASHGGTGGEIGTTPSMDSEPAAPPQQPALATASQEGVGQARRGGGRGTGGRARLSDIFRWPLGGGGTVLTLPPAAAVVPGASPDLGGGGHFLSTSAGAMFTMDDMTAASASSAASSVNHPCQLNASAVVPQSTRLDRRPPRAGPSAFNTPGAAMLLQASALSQRVGGQMGDLNFDGKRRAL